MSSGNSGHQVSEAKSTPEAADLPLIARVLNHVLTPGSSLTSSVWTAFNVIMLWLFVCWLLFVFSFPYNIHVWAFGILGLGLTLATNWFLSEIFKAGLDFDSQQRKAAATEKAGSKKATQSAVTSDDKPKKKPQPQQLTSAKGSDKSSKQNTKKGK